MDTSSHEKSNDEKSYMDAKSTHTFSKFVPDLSKSPEFEKTPFNEVFKPPNEFEHIQDIIELSNDEVEQKPPKVTREEFMDIMSHMQDMFDKHKPKYPESRGYSSLLKKLDNNDESLNQIQSAKNNLNDSDVCWHSQNLDNKLS